MILLTQIKSQNQTPKTNKTFAFWSLKTLTKSYPLKRVQWQGWKNQHSIKSPFTRCSESLNPCKEHPNLPSILLVRQGPLRWRDKKGILLRSTRKSVRALWGRLGCLNAAVRRIRFANVLALVCSLTATRDFVWYDISAFILNAFNSHLIQNLDKAIVAF